MSTPLFAGQLRIAATVGKCAREVRKLSLMLLALALASVNEATQRTENQNTYEGRGAYFLDV